jgi:hypothetical protein
MSTYTRARTKAQHRHPGSRSLSHLRDKKQAEARKGVIYIAITDPEEEEILPALDALKLKGSERIVRGDADIECDHPEQLSDYIEVMAEDCGWFYQHRKKRGKMVWVQREDPNPILVLTITAAPWLNIWIRDQLAAGKDVQGILNELWARFRVRAKDILKGDRERYFLGDAIHCDTRGFHGDLVLTRQVDGQRVGKAGLDLSGPWLVGCDRQLRVGATVSQLKKGWFDRSVQSHFRRHGRNSKPCDVLLARAFDRVAEEMVGPALASYKTTYAAGVPAQELRNAEATLARIDATRAKVASALSALKPSTPSPGHY